ncbi:MAG TPA: hypothetical protein VJJ98_06915 [Sedimentisphaerales bacterium]|nr:hypothetical protein [Sedimentisphaerales bacterium]
MDTILYIVGCVLFLMCITGYIIVQVRLRPRDDSDLDDYYHEFEEQHAGYARYLRWSRITLTGAIIAALMLLLTRVF